MGRSGYKEYQQIQKCLNINVCFLEQLRRDTTFNAILCDVGASCNYSKPAMQWWPWPHYIQNRREEKSIKTQHYVTSTKSLKKCKKLHSTLTKIPNIKVFLTDTKRKAHEYLSKICLVKDLCSFLHSIAKTLTYILNQNE